MPAPNALPDPQWTEGPTECVNCGYSLEGLAIPGRCPECGAPFAAQVMILHGVPRTSTGGPLWRKLVWIGLIILGILFSQLWFVLLMLSWIVLVVVGAALLAGVAAMFATGKRERSGTERFMFTSSGVARLPGKRNETAAGTAMDTIFVPYTSAARLRIDTVSPVWRRIRIMMPNEHNVLRTVFDAGFRCPTDAVDRVHATITAAIRGESPPAFPLPLPAVAHPPTAPGELAVPPGA